MDGEQSIDDLIDESQDDFDDNSEVRESQLEQMDSSYTYPEQHKQQGILEWFWRVAKLDSPDQLVRVANLTKQEIGFANISNRDALNLALLGRIFHHEKFGQYFADRAKITSITSMSRDGWFMDLSISQKRVRERAKSSPSLNPGEQPWRIFKKKQSPQEQAAREQ
jgi:hypothetical protein